MYFLYSTPTPELRVAVSLLRLQDHVWSFSSHYHLLSVWVKEDAIYLRLPSLTGWRQYLRRNSSCDQSKLH